MNRRRSSDGYAMLAALLIIVLAAGFALVVIGAVGSLHVVERSDAGGWRAEGAAACAVTATTAALRWKPCSTSGSAEHEDPQKSESWRASWEPAPPVAGGVCPRLRVRVSAAAGGASREEQLTMEIGTEPWAMGVTCSGDAEIRERFEVSGSGVYVGGCLRGRENVGFVTGAGAITAAGDPADGVHGDVFPAAAVHGGAGIFARGTEIHQPSGGGAYPLDTDRHTGEEVPAGWLVPPLPEFLAAAVAASSSPGNALDGTRLSLDEVQTPMGAAATGGSCIVVPAMDAVTVTGSPPPEAGRLLVIIRGDAVLGEPGETVSLSGGLVVCGHLLVRGGLRLLGSLHADSMAIDGPTCVEVAADWRSRPLAGASVPTLLEHGE